VVGWAGGQLLRHLDKSVGIGEQRGVLGDGLPRGPRLAQRPYPPAAAADLGIARPRIASRGKGSGSTARPSVRRGRTSQVSAPRSSRRSEPSATSSAWPMRAEGGQASAASLARSARACAQYIYTTFLCLVTLSLYDYIVAACGIRVIRVITLSNVVADTSM
jgi:hypothetical protein